MASQASKPINIRKSIEDRRSEDSDRPMLSAGTMEALNEFLLETQAAANGTQNPFAENWGLSQARDSCACPRLLHQNYSTFRGGSLLGY